MKKYFGNDYFYLVVFSLVLFGFILAKIDALSLPLFWDEMGVYGKAVFAHLEGGISLNPIAMDPEISRGHPQLYSAIIAVFAKLFGSNVFGFRLGALIISVITLLTLFFIGSSWYSKKIGLAACVLLVSQPLFYAQSTMVLPELSLGLFLLWALYFLDKERWVLYFLSASSMILIKETSVILLPVFGLFSLWVNRKESFIQQFKKLVLVGLAVVPLFVFLFVQKSTYGWYFFPYHSGGFDFSSAVVCLKLIDYLQFIFMDQGRWLASLLLLVGLILSGSNMLRTKKVFFIALGFVIFLLFSVSTFYLNRYFLLFLIVYPVLISLACQQIFFSVKNVLINGLLFWMAVIGLSLMGISEMNVNEGQEVVFKYDEDMSYVHHLAVMDEAVDFISTTEFKQKGITSFFPMVYALESADYGYLEKGVKIYRKFKLTEKSDYLILTSNNGGFKEFSDWNLVLIESFKSEYAEARIYKVLGKE